MVRPESIFGDFALSRCNIARAPNKHRNPGCPSTDEFANLMLGSKRYGRLPLHAKEVGEIDMNELRALAERGGTMEHYATVHEWTQNAKSYKDVKPTVDGGCSLPIADTKLLKYRKYIETAKGGKTHGWVRVFAKKEIAKKRRRALEHTFDVNDQAPAAVKIALANIYDVQRLVFQGRKCVQLDMAAFFFQFGLGDGVRPYFRFTANGELLQMTRMAMGQKHACSVAQACLKILAAGLKTVRILYIDNIIFVDNDEQAIIKDVRKFIERCKQVGATLNESIDGTINDDDDSITAMMKPEQDILGVHLDFEARTKCSSAKTIGKIKDVLAARTRWTARNLSSYLALLYFCSSVHTRPLPGFYDAIQCGSRLHQTLGRDTTQPSPRWSSPVGQVISITDAEEANLAAWAATELANAPTPCEEKCTPTPEIFIFSDASANGWGGVALGHKEILAVVSGRWKEGGAWASSSKAEPWGLLAALTKMRHLVKDKTILIFSDNVGLVCALNKKRAHGYHANAVVGRILLDFPDTSFVSYHVSGSLNISDEPSRNIEKIDSSKLDSVFSKLDEMSKENTYTNLVNK